MSKISRRSFLSWVAKGAAILGVSSVVGSSQISIPQAAGASNQDDAFLNEKVVDFTNIEDTTLDLWLQLENANLDVIAATLLNVGLLFEHYLSQLNPNPRLRSLTEKYQLETYKENFLTSVTQAAEALGIVPPITPLP